MIFFFHVAGMHGWKEIFEEIYNEFKNSGLLAAAEKRVIGFIGSKEDLAYLQSRAVESEIYYFGEDFKQYEFPTLELLDNYCRSKAEEKKVLYVHTKGVSNPAHVGKKYWRRAMIKSVITEWRSCSNRLNRYDAVGYNLHRRNPVPMTHFSGNWWWVRSSFIKKCRPISFLRKNPIRIGNWPNDESKLRFQCEFWLRTGLRNSGRFISTGVENFINEYNIDPIVKLDYNQDPFDFAGLVVDKRFVINIEEQKTRLDSALQEINKACIRDVKVFKAITPESPEGSRLKTKGQLGCYLSNKSCIEEAYHSNANAVLILEDDVSFAYGFQELFKQAYSDIPSDWDIIFIGSNEKTRLPRKIVAGMAAIPNEHWGTHCYLLSRSGIEKVYEYFKANPTPTYEIDMLLTNQIKGLKQYSFFPSLATQIARFPSNTRNKPTRNGAPTTN